MILTEDQIRQITAKKAHSAQARELVAMRIPFSRSRQEISQMTDEEMMEVWFAAHKSACGFVEGIQEFGRLIRLAEREECAQIADQWATDEQRTLGNGGPSAAIAQEQK